MISGLKVEQLAAMFSGMYISNVTSSLLGQLIIIKNTRGNTKSKSCNKMLFKPR